MSARVLWASRDDDGARRGFRLELEHYSSEGEAESRGSLWVAECTVNAGEPWRATVRGGAAPVEVVWRSEELATVALVLPPVREPEVMS